MSSLIVFPFKSEDTDIFSRNIREALSHPAVSAVLGIGFEHNECYRAMEDQFGSHSRVRFLVQDRLGARRPGKGDGMNTGLRVFLDHPEYERLHFYDANIKTFTREWIARAEEGADEGYQVIRHYFPRASTDAMITWMITKTGFALIAPQTQLTQIEQPLGGELLLTREVAGTLFQDDAVRAQSDWGIDTLYTWTTFHHGFSLYETYRETGKIHKLYGRLTDLKTMLIECFAAIQALRDAPAIARAVRHDIEPPTPAPEDVRRKTAYDVEGTMNLLMEDWTDRQAQLLDQFPDSIRDAMLQCRTKPRFGFMDEAAWYSVYRILLDAFDPADEDWGRLLFKLWVARVLDYTMQTALKGSEYAVSQLHGMVERYRLKALREMEAEYRGRRRTRMSGVG